jgi:phospholipase/carboxylesterase
MSAARAAGFALAAIAAMGAHGDPATEGRLLARPGAIPERPGPAGEAPLGLSRARDGLVYVPARVDRTRPAPLVVLLHGAGGDARGTLGILRAHADALGAILLVPESREATWDVIVEAYGPDVAFLDAALARVFTRHAIDPARIAIAGFSDGASYALSIGLANGDLFSDVLAFSPGFAAPPRELGRPRVFVSHGVHDRVLPIERCSRRIVLRLRAEGYDVDYREFDGGHSVPEALAREAFEAFVHRKN